MQTIRKIFKPAALLLALHVLMLSGPYHTVSAAMIGTEAMIHIDRGQQTRDRLHHHLLRDDIKSLLESRGIDPLEVQARIAEVKN